MLIDMSLNSLSVAYVMTPQGRGGVATVCLRGEVTLLDEGAKYGPVFRLARGGRCADQPLGDVVFGHWGDEHREEVVVCRVHENVTEIHCHGGKAAVERILGDLRTRDCAVITWAEYVAEESTTLEVECLQALTQATTLRTAQQLLAQQQGALASRLGQLLARDGVSLRDGLHELLRWSVFGLHLTAPWSVVLCGRPNVGKSSLINALVGYTRAIVYDQPGTTRDVVQAETALEGWPFIFSDTAGLRDGGEQLEQLGIVKARQQMESADLLIVVIDGSQPIDDADLRLVSDHPECLVVLSKSDLPMHDDPIAFQQSHASSQRVSAINGTGIEALQQAIVAQLIPELPEVSAPLPFALRQVACLRAAASAETEALAKQFVQQCLNSTDKIGVVCRTKSDSSAT